MPKNQQLANLQQYLANTGRYHGTVDGLWGKQTEAGIILGFTDGPDTALTDYDFSMSADRLGVQVAAIKAFASVEAAGSGFANGVPKILAEPHVFSRLTGHVYDGSNPTVSYRKWGARPYPKSQDARYNQLLQMIRLDSIAGFQSASYGKFQLMGFHFKTCGYATPWEFAFAQAKDEATQLQDFEDFIKSVGIVPHLKSKNWDEVARRYNGEGYKANAYHTKLAKAFASFGGK